MKNTSFSYTKHALPFKSQSELRLVAMLCIYCLWLIDGFSFRLTDLDWLIGVFVGVILNHRKTHWKYCSQIFEILLFKRKVPRPKESIAAEKQEFKFEFLFSSFMAFQNFQFGHLGLVHAVGWISKICIRGFIAGTFSLQLFQEKFFYSILFSNG